MCRIRGLSWALGIVAGGLLYLLGGFCYGAFACQSIYKLLVTDGLHCSGIFRDALGKQILNLFHQPQLQHRIHPLIDPLVKPAAVTVLQAKPDRMKP